MPYLGIFGLEFENNIAIFEVSTVEFIQLQNFVKKKTKRPKFEIKIVLIEYL